MTKLSAYIRTYDVASKMSPRFFLASSTIQESKSGRPCFLRDLAGWQYSFSRRKTPFYLLTNRFNTATIAALVSSSMFLSRSSNDDEFTLARTPNPPPPPPLPCCKNHFPFQSIVMAVSIGHGTLDTNVPPSFRADLIPLRIS